MQPEDKGSYWQPRTYAPQGVGVAQAPTPLGEDRTESSADASPALSWQASEYIHHEKQGMWFAALVGGAFILLVAAFFLLGSSWTFWSFAILVVVMTLTLSIYAVRLPRIMSYTLTDEGIVVNDRQFRYDDFRYFGIIEDGPLYSAQLVSTKRFVPAVNLYFPGESGEQVVDLLGAHLPMHHVEPDFIDKLMRRLRF